MSEVQSKNLGDYFLVLFFFEAFLIFFFQARLVLNHQKAHIGASIAAITRIDAKTMAKFS